MLTLRVAIIGAGRMGKIRALSARAHPQCEVVHVSDQAADLARALSLEFSCSYGTHWRQAVERDDVDAVVVATPHKFLAPIAAAAVRHGKYVFCEKPMARSSTEGKEILAALGRSKDATLAPAVVVGYTLRHHAAIARAKELVSSGAIGEPFYVRGRYGHGGRSGYEREWRGNRELAGGGELLDQGVHLIDLSRWILGEFSQVFGFVNSYFWKPEQKSSCHDSTGELSADESLGGKNVEDNAFILMRTAQEKTAMLHVSWTQWKNLFTFEIFGPQGSVSVDGLGGSYGEERLTLARRLSGGGAPEMTEIRFNQVASAGNGGDGWRANQEEAAITVTTNCWDEEWADFVRAIEKPNPKRAATAADGYENLKIVDALYHSARHNTPVNLNSFHRHSEGESKKLDVACSAPVSEVHGQL
ncbi:MAG: Gfo/Idh/MocA family oxidoreductase [Acidobacteria bacterium]|nr:Gfo/Idh/MocA family oxidoreductase [Acidobacteriota bacterium]